MNATTSQLHHPQTPHRHTLTIQNLILLLHTRSFHTPITYLDIMFISRIRVHKNYDSNKTSIRLYVMIS